MRIQADFMAGAFVIMVILLLTFGAFEDMDERLYDKELCESKGMNWAGEFRYRDLEYPKAAEGYIVCFQEVYEDNLLVDVEYVAVKKE